MPSAWNQAWADRWASAWGAATIGKGCAWGGNWGNSWGQSWCHEIAPEPVIILVGGDDAPRRRRRKREKTQHELFQELEDTVHALVHSRPAVDEPAEVPAEFMAGTARRAVDELLVLAEGQHQLLQRAAKLQAQLEQIEAERQRMLDEEDELMLWL